MVAYFVYSNGTALSSNEVEKMLSDPDHYVTLTNLGLMYIVSSVLKIFCKHGPVFCHHILSLYTIINLLISTLVD